MAISVNVNLNGLNGLNGRINDGRKWAANQALQEMHNFVPMKRNHLRDSGTIDANGYTIHYAEPYAHAQFVGLIDNKYPIRNYTTPGTGKRWDLRLKGDAMKMQNVEKAFINGANLRGSNK